MSSANGLGLSRVETRGAGAGNGVPISLGLFFPLPAADNLRLRRIG